MKSIFSLAIAAIVLFGIGLSQPAMAQNGGGKGLGNKGTVHANFVDANGDGICDNFGTGTCKGTGTCTGTGKGTGTGTGKGTGTCNGTGQRLRLRDGSCGITPAPPTKEMKQPKRIAPSSK